MQKYGQEGVCLFVFRLTYVEPKHQSDLTYPSWYKWFSALDLGILNMSAISHML